MATQRPVSLDDMLDMNTNTNTNTNTVINTDTDPTSLVTGAIKEETEKEEAVEEEECIELKHLNYKSMLQGGKRRDIDSKTSHTTAETLDTLDAFLATTTETNKTERWNRLDKTTKLKKMTEFAKRYATENEYSEEEEASLAAYLRDCLDKKKLARVKDVEYDNATDQLVSIPGLQYSKTSKKHTIKNMDGKRTSVLKSLPNRKTVKVKPDTTQ